MVGCGAWARNIICITLGTGVGGGIILDGKLWRGTDGSAGEIGHTTVDPFGGPKCKCGNFGCLEMYASATAMVRMTREGLDRFPNSILQGQSLTAKTIYDAGKAGDELALETFKKVGDYLGVGLANLMNLLGPEVIVIGGGAANAWDLFEGHMLEQIRSRAVSVIVSTRKDQTRGVRRRCGSAWRCPVGVHKSSIKFFGADVVPLPLQIQFVSPHFEFYTAKRLRLKAQGCRALAATLGEEFF